MLDLNKLPRSTKMIILIMALSFSGIVLFYLWILSFDFSKFNLSEVFESNGNLQNAVENIKLLPSFWDVIKSNSSTILDIVKEALTEISSSTSSTPQELKNQESQKQEFEKKIKANLGDTVFQFEQLPLSK